MKSKKTIVATTAVAFALAGGGFAVGRETQKAITTANPNGNNAPVPNPSQNGSFPSFADLAARVSPAVVNVKVTSVEKAAFPDQFGQDFPSPGFQLPIPRQPKEFKRQGTGSGFIISKDGLILTNYHVIDNAQAITVTLSDKRQYKAKIVGRDPKTDLAVLKIEAKESLPTIALGDSSVLRVGDWVMAIGNPFGLTNTVTTGIVSAKGRTIGAGPYDNFIQTDAPINPGNSGGPLFNMAGEVVGINAAIFSQSGGNVGIGFAIPVNLVKNLLPQLETKGTVTRGWLGVSIQPVTAELARSFNLKQTEGALVGDVTADGPAQKAGIKRGDVIVSFDGNKVNDATALPMLVASAPVGKTVPVQVIRDGKMTTVNVETGKMNDQTAAVQTENNQSEWGLSLRNIRPEERRQMGLNANSGVVVTAVVPASPAADSGIQPGDVILQVNQVPVNSVEAVKQQAAKNTGDKPLLMLVRRADGSTMFAALSHNVG
ncbi:MAG TPA: DegQ family serine endoprotease [Candidatus Saccharimonadales bacterium]|nr:DegQ family serine endoprotease [Candidatus Saccharimonadales bacterium]